MKQKLILITLAAALGAFATLASNPKDNHRSVVERLNDLEALALMQQEEINELKTELAAVHETIDPFFQRVRVTRGGYIACYGNVLVFGNMQVIGEHFAAPTIYYTTQIYDPYLPTHE